MRFGWGLVIMDAAAWMVASWIALRLAISFIYHGHRWLGALILGLALWGILALDRQGGSFGAAILGYPGSTFWAVLRILGLVLLASYLVAGRGLGATGAFSSVAAWIASGLSRFAQVFPLQLLPGTALRASAAARCSIE